MTQRAYWVWLCAGLALTPGVRAAECSSGALAARLPESAARLREVACALETTADGELGEVRGLLRDQSNASELLATLRALRPATGRREAHRYITHPQRPAFSPHRRRAQQRVPMLASTGEPDALLPAEPTSAVTWWLLASTDNSEQDAASELDAFDADSQALALGVERSVGSYVFSISAGYLRGDVDSGRLGDDEIRARQIGLGASRTLGAHTFALNLGFTDSDTDRERVVPVVTNNGIRAFTLTSGIDATQYAVGLGWSGYWEPGAHVSVSPSLALGYNRLRTDDYIERGSGNLALEVATEDTEQVLLSAGVNVAYLAMFGDWLVSPNLSVGMDQDLQADAMSSTSRFRGTNFRFSTQGFEVEETRWRFGGGLQLLHLSGFGASLAIEAQRNGDYSANVAALSLQGEL